MPQQMQQILRSLGSKAIEMTPTTPSGTAIPTTESFESKTESPGDDDSLTTAATASSSGRATSPSTNNLSGRPYPTPNNPDEEWIVLWDETFECEYFHETKSGVSQWHAPGLINDTAGSFISIDSLDADLDSFLLLDGAQTITCAAAADSSSLEPEMINIHNQNQNRILKYRAKRRRLRRKKILRAAAVVLTCLGAYYYFRYYRSSSGNNSINKKNNSLTMTSDPLTGVASTIEQKDHSVSNLARPKGPEEKPRVPEPVFEEPKKVKDEKSFWTHDHETTATVSDLMDLECEEEEEDEEDEDVTAPTVVQGRPVGCNIPLAHVVSKKCSKLATEQPVFDLHGLVHFMMQ